MEEENKIDQLFRQGLDHSDIPFNELDWEKMEFKLDEQHKKRIFPLWLLTASGIAALFTLLVFWYFSESNGVQTILKKSALAQSTHKKPEQQPAQVIENVSTIHPTTKNSFSIKTLPSFLHGQHHESKRNENSQTIKIEPVQLMALNHEPILITPIETAKLTVTEPIDPKSVTIQELIHIRKDIDYKSEHGLLKTQTLTLSLVAAPDISVTKMSKPSKLSSNFGVLANYNLTKRISFTSGIIYAKKRYNYTGLGQQTNAIAAYPWDVNADCDVLDIPINVNYKLLDHKKYAISLNAGASSYVMLKEKYQFTPSNPSSPQNPRSIEIKNENQYLFGVANIGLSINREISRGLSIGVQPFIKLPLTGIGYGNARLRSTGISFSLNMDLFPRE
jgi:hypothetical protein